MLKTLRGSIFNQWISAYYGILEMNKQLILLKHIKTNCLSNRLIPDKPLGNIGYPAQAYPGYANLAYPVRVLLIPVYPICLSRL